MYDRWLAWVVRLLLALLVLGVAPAVTAGAAPFQRGPVGAGPEDVLVPNTKEVQRVLERLMRITSGGSLTDAAEMLGTSPQELDRFFTNRADRRKEFTHVELVRIIETFTENDAEEREARMALFGPLLRQLQELSISDLVSNDVQVRNTEELRAALVKLVGTIPPSTLRRQILDEVYVDQCSEALDQKFIDRTQQPRRVKALWSSPRNYHPAAELEVLIRGGTCDREKRDELREAVFGPTIRTLKTLVDGPSNTLSACPEGQTCEVWVAPMISGPEVLREVPQLAEYDTRASRTEYLSLRATPSAVVEGNSPTEDRMMYATRIMPPSGGPDPVAGRMETMSGATLIPPAVSPVSWSGVVISPPSLTSFAWWQR